MKKAIVFLVLILSFSVKAYASNTDEYYKDQLEKSGADKLADCLSDETAEYLKKIGLDEPEFEKILAASPKAVFSLLGELIKDGYKKPLEGMLEIVGAVMLVSVFSGFFPEDEKSKNVLCLICGSFTVVTIFAQGAESVRAAASAMEACAVFEKALVPVMAAILTAGGNPTAALSMKGAAFAAAEFVEEFAKSVVLPLVGISGTLGVMGSLVPTLRLSAVGDLIRKTATTFLSVTATLFLSFMTLKSFISSSVDGLAAKGIKLATNTFVPVIGGALGEAYSSFLGSLSLLKTTVGIYAVAVIFVIAVPVMIDLVLWIFALKTACAASELLNCGQCSEIIKNISYIFSAVNTLLLLCVVVFVITAGLTVVIKTGE